MSQQVISYADLSIINNAIRSINNHIGKINTEVNEINFKQDQLESDLDKLATAFSDFVEADLRHKGLQLAETRVGNLKQDLQIKYGYYAEIRRMATGILQSADTGVIGNDTLRFTTEEVMIKAPGYWLAPALVALAAWLRDDKTTATKALNESLKRDDYRSTLFFLLVMRRLNRLDASLEWLKRYFMHQNPHQLDREFIVVLEAVTTGMFPPAAKQLMMLKVKSWLEQLSEQGNYTDQQKKQWIGFFDASKPQLREPFQLLKKYASNYDALEEALRRAMVYEVMRLHFEGILSTSPDLSKAVKVQLDEILSLLVTNFDDEELPLQKQVRLNELIIEMDGDKKSAQYKMDAEEHIFNEQVDFLQLLTNAAFNPELSGATKVTQALAVSISQPWILEAHDEFTARNRQKIPQFVELKIDGFKTQTANGFDERDQLDAQDAFYDQELANALAALSFPYAMVIIGILVAIFGGYLLTVNSGVLGVIALLIGALIAWNSYNQHSKAIAKVKADMEVRRSKGKEVLRGCIAETVDYRNAYGKEDFKAETLRDTLSAITPEDFSSVSRETSRNINLN